MLETARVAKVEKSAIFVNITGTASCSQCEMGGHCPFNSNSKSTTLIPRPKNFDIKEGDYVEFETPKNLSATKLSVLLYGIPIVIFIGGTIALLGLTTLGNFGSLGISLAGAGIYYLLLTLYTKKHEERFSPYIVKKIDPPVDIDISNIGDLQ